jgi:dTDP-4-dehydrorhamnose reductase
MSVKRLALIGANGMLARKVRELAPPYYEVVGFDLPEFDLTNREQVLDEMVRLQPAVIVNCAAYTNVDGCESREELATRVNGAGPGYLAAAAQVVGAVLAHISTDYVFAGDKGRPYEEDDPTGPLSAYGRSKLAGEQAIVASGLTHYFILRTSWLYGPGGKNFVETMLRLAAERDELRVVADQIGSPTYTGDLAQAIYRLLAVADQPDVFGIYHLADLGECSWYDFAAEIISQARQMGEILRVEQVVPIVTSDYPLPAPRPAYSVFSKEKYLTVTRTPLPHWQESLALYLRERKK